MSVFAHKGNKKIRKVTGAGLLFLFVMMGAMLICSLKANGVDGTTLNRKDTSEISALKNRLRVHVEFLTGIYPPRNYRNLQSLNKCAEYIENEFKTFPDNVKRQKYLVETNEYKNIICVLNPTGTNTVVIGAHYDVCREQSGADDNASGIAGLLEIGRLLSAETLKQLRIELVGFTLEEPPFFGTIFMGSYQHAKMLKDNNVNLDFMMCLDMIGYYSGEKNSQKYPLGIMRWFYGNIGNFIAVVGRTEQGRLDKEIREI